MTKSRTPSEQEVNEELNRLLDKYLDQVDKINTSGFVPTGHVRTLIEAWEMVNKPVLKQEVKPALSAIEELEKRIKVPSGIEPGTVANLVKNFGLYRKPSPITSNQPEKKMEDNITNKSGPKSSK